MKSADANFTPIFTDIDNISSADPDEDK